MGSAIVFPIEGLTVILGVAGCGDNEIATGILVAVQLEVGLVVVTVKLYVPTVETEFPATLNVLVVIAGERAVPSRFHV
jgi:hypothetical protein